MRALSGLLAGCIFFGCSPEPRAPVAPATGSTASASGKPSAFADTLTRLCTGPSSVPMEIAGGREYVEVTLPGGKSPEPLRFHVDSGGNTRGLMIHRSAVERLGFTADTLPRTLHVGDRDIPLPDGASWLVADDTDAGARQRRGVMKDFMVGQLGAGFLSRFVVCIDPGHGRMAFGDPKEFDLQPGDATWVPLLMMPGGDNHALYPFVHLLLLDHGTPVGGYGVLLDTGASNSMLDRDKIDYQHQQHAAYPFAVGAFGDADFIGGQYAEEVLAVPDVAVHTPGDPSSYGLKERTQIDLGPARFVDRPTGTWGRMFGELPVTMGAHGALANDVLLRHRIVLDYPHARLFADPAPHTEELSASTSRVGVAIRFGDDGCPEVRQVTDTNTPDTRAKLQIGDVLLTIDGKDACKMARHEVQAALAGPAGTVKKVHLRRGSGALDVEVETAELLGPRVE